MVMVHEEVTMMPDLVVLEVGEGDSVEPVDFLRDGEVEGREDGETEQPDRVVRWVKLDDMFR